MQEVYNLSSSDRVKRLENDLAKDLQELQIAIEENDFLSNSTVASKTFRLMLQYSLYNVNDSSFIFILFIFL